MMSSGRHAAMNSPSCVPKTPLLPQGQHQQMVVETT
jgi:hypothetical protein